jgi:acyl-ACP thioesterase
VGLADVDRGARMRLDAMARIVQDVADEDVATAGVPGMGMWILRKLHLVIAHTPRFRADVDATTWCSGLGRRWAERRTDLVVDETTCVEATAVWVHVDPERGTPAPLPPGFTAVWGDGNGRRVSARLQHGAPPAGASTFAWYVRAADVDVVDHVNNAAYWTVAEEVLTRRGRPRVEVAEIEFRAGLSYGEPVSAVVAEREGGFMVWLLVGGDVRASMLVGCAT